MQSNDGFGSPTYPASQPGYLRHRPSPFQQSSHTTPAEALFSKEVLDPPTKTGIVLPGSIIAKPDAPHLSSRVTGIGYLVGLDAFQTWRMMTSTGNSHQSHNCCGDGFSCARQGVRDKAS